MEGSILVVSNEVSFSRALRIMLAAKGYEVTNTTSIEDAIVLGDSGRFDLVLLDSDTSCESAAEACQAIRACSDAAIIVVSGDNSDAGKSRTIRAGANAYMSKPFGVTEMFAAVREHSRRRLVTVNS